MAAKTVTQETAATALTGAELVRIVQGGASAKTTVADIATFVAGVPSFTQSGTGAVARTVQDKLQESVSVKDFGAVGDGVADDTAAITAADADTGKKFVPRGTYDTALAAGNLDGPYFGEGQIRDTSNSLRAPWFSAIKAAPSSFGDAASVSTAFNGDLSKNQIAMEHRITGAATLGQPTTGYVYRPEVMPIFGYLYNESGHNESTSGNGGRTGVAFQRVMVFQAGQGDAVAYNASAFVTGAKPGATSFLANPAAVLFNGDMTAGSAGVYLNPFELSLNDGGFDAACVGLVVNQSRTVGTGALGAYWSGLRVQSLGAQALDQFAGAVGKFKNGLDFAASSMDFGANQAAISLKQNQRIYFNNASANDVFSTVYNGDYIGYSSASSSLNFVAGGAAVLQLTAGQVTVATARFLANGAVTLSGLGNYADDAAAAAASVPISGIYRNGGILQIRVA